MGLAPDVADENIASEIREKGEADETHAYVSTSTGHPSGRVVGVIKRNWRP